MQQDLHYYGIAFLARAAGFSRSDTEILAYASQYVDDSTEGSPIHVGNYLFNPIRTAHYSLRAYTWGVQSKIYIPFHFLPPKPRRCNLITADYPNSSLAKLLFNRACSEADPKQRLFRLGVALHTIADTYSHQGFSGRDHDENRLASCHIKNKKLTRNADLREKVNELTRLVWQRLKRIIRPVVPTIGHAQAIHTPDIPYLKWSYSYIGDKPLLSRNNPKVFLQACKQIYELLGEAVQPRKRKNAAKAPKRVEPLKTWSEISPHIKECLRSSVYTLEHNQQTTADEEYRCICWQKMYKECFNEDLTSYDKYLWRTEALRPVNPEHVRWDTLSKDEISKYTFNHNPKFFASSWVKFHRAAMTQRYLVLYHLL